MSLDITNVRTWLKSLLDGDYQSVLVSGTNIKTINNNSLLGSGNITIGGGGSGGISIDDVYPIGSIYMSVNSTNPSVLFGGTWEQIEDRFLLSAGSTYSNGSIGGSADAIVVEHTHTFSKGGTAITVGSDSAQFTNGFGSGSHWNGSNANNGSISSSGESGTGKNMPPYLVVYVWKRVADITYDSVALTSNKSILSQADSETLTLSAQLMNGQSSDTTSGVTVEFFKGSTSLGTATTNSSGIATKSYSANGDGDISFTCSVGEITSSSVSVEDCVVYHPSAINYTGTSANDTAFTLGYDSIGDLQTNFELSFKFKQTGKGCYVCLGASSEYTAPSKSNYRVYCGSSGSSAFAYGYRTTTTSNSTNGTVSTNTEYTMKIAKNNTTFTYYLEGTSKGTKTVSWWGNYSDFCLHGLQWNTGTTTISELKLKKVS